MKRASLRANATTSAVAERRTRQSRPRVKEEEGQGSLPTRHAATNCAPGDHVAQNKRFRLPPRLQRVLPPSPRRPATSLQPVRATRRASLPAPPARRPGAPASVRPSRPRCPLSPAAWSVTVAAVRWNSVRWTSADELLPAHDHDGAVSVPHDGVRSTAHQSPPYPAVAATAHDDQPHFQLLG
jgi:hypothetical protein